MWSKIYYHRNEIKLLIKFYTINYSHLHHLIPLIKQTVEICLNGRKLRESKGENFGGIGIPYFDNKMEEKKFRRIEYIIFFKILNFPKLKRFNEKMLSSLLFLLFPFSCLLNKISIIFFSFFPSFPFPSLSFPLFSFFFSIPSPPFPSLYFPFLSL